MKKGNATLRKGRGQVVGAARWLLRVRKKGPWERLVNLLRRQETGSAPMAGQVKMGGEGRPSIRSQNLKLSFQGIQQKPKKTRGLPGSHRTLMGQKRALQR